MLEMTRFRHGTDEETAHIVEATRIWRETWILPVLDALIEELPADHLMIKQ
jgi:hypothetical protein